MLGAASSFPHSRWSFQGAHTYRNTWRRLSKVGASRCCAQVPSQHGSLWWEVGEGPVSSHLTLAWSLAAEAQGPSLYIHCPLSGGLTLLRTETPNYWLFLFGKSLFPKANSSEPQRPFHFLDQLIFLMQKKLNLTFSRRKVLSLQHKGLGWGGHNPLLFVPFMSMKICLTLNKFSLHLLQNRWGDAQVKRNLPKQWIYLFCNFSEPLLCTANLQEEVGAGSASQMYWTLQPFGCGAPLGVAAWLSAPRYPRR